MKLTDEQIEELWMAHVLPGFGERQKFYSPLLYARAIEAEVLRINGGGGEVEKHCMNCAAFGECHPNNDAGRCGYEPPAAPQPQQAAPGAVLEGFKCEVVEADFEKNTVTVEMKSKDWRIHAGEYMLSAAPKPQGE